VGADAPYHRRRRRPGDYYYYYLYYDGSRGFHPFFFAAKDAKLVPAAVDITKPAAPRVRGATLIG